LLIPPPIGRGHPRASSEMRLRGPKGERTLGAEEFFSVPMTTASKPTEILTEIRLPLPMRRRVTRIRKWRSQRRIRPVGVAVSLKIDAREFARNRHRVTGLSDRPFALTRSKTAYAAQVDRQID